MPLVYAARDAQAAVNHVGGIDATSNPVDITVDNATPFGASLPILVTLEANTVRSETVLCTAIVGNVLTCSRLAYGSAMFAHADHTPVESTVGAYGWNQTKAAIEARFAQGGTAFGAPGLLGTSDNQPLALLTNGVARIVLDTAGNVAVGSAAPSPAGAVFDLADQKVLSAPTTTWRGVRSVMTATPGASGASLLGAELTGCDAAANTQAFASLFGVSATAKVQGSGAVGAVYGVQAQVQTGTNAAPVTLSTGVNVLFTHASGLVSTHYGVHVMTPTITSPGTATTVFGVHVEAQRNTAGGSATAGGYTAYGGCFTVPAQGGNTAGTDTNYGLRITGNGGSPGGGGMVTNWALYADSPANSYFAGNVGLGTQTPSPSSALTVLKTLTDPTGTPAMVSATLTHLVSGDSTGVTAQAASFSAVASSSPYRYGTLVGVQAVASMTGNGANGATIALQAVSASTKTDGGAPVSTNSGGFFEAVNSGAGIHTTVQGIWARARLSSSGSVGNAYGVRGTVVNQGTVPITTAAAIQADAPTLTGAGTLTTAYGIQVGAQWNTAGGAATAGGYNAYGVYVNVPTQGGNTTGVDTNTAIRIVGNGGAPNTGGTVTNWALYSDSTAPSLLTGDLTLAGAIKHTGTLLGFFNHTAVVKPSVSGSRGGNAAVASLITALAGLGLLTDLSSA